MRFSRLKRFGWRSTSSIGLWRVQTFIDSKYRACYNGRATTNEEICGFLIATLFAGQHTSSITSAWTGYNMLNTKVRLCSPSFDVHCMIMSNTHSIR